MPIRIINHKGNDVIFADYSEYKTLEEQISFLREAEAFILSKGDDLLVLSDFSNVRGNAELMSEMKRAGKEIEHKVKKSATIGITGLKKVFLSGYNLVVKDKVMAFNTQEQALDYLIE